MNEPPRGVMRSQSAGQEFEEFVAQVTAAVTGIDGDVEPQPGGIADPWFLDAEKIVRRWPYPQEWLHEPAD